MNSTAWNLLRISLPPLLLVLFQAAFYGEPINALSQYANNPSAVIEIFPGDSFEAAVESLNPGDTLLVHGGTYADTGRISITVQGTELAPVVISGVEGEPTPLIMRPVTAAAQNTINIEGATHLTIYGLEITSNGGDGVKITNDSAYITLENLHIHGVDVGVNFKDNLHHITVRQTHIHDTGTGNTTGEGMYIGCHDGSCATSDSLIEGNWIHDTLGASQGDGIEIKKGSHSNVVQDNVIYNTHYPCILLYGTQGNPRNTVERNVMWNCGDSGIQVAADAILVNNIILNSPQNGLNSQDHNGVTPSNLTVSHNTIVGGSPCLRLSNWANKPGMVFSNNAVYCEGGSYVIAALTGVAISGNVIYPATALIPASGYTVGRSTALDFLDAGNFVVYPSFDSALIDVEDSAYSTAVDFNATVRTGVPDAGAYTWTGPANPGWTIQEGFKILQPLAGLALGMSGEPNPASTGLPLTFTLTVHNQNPITATGVVLTNTLPVNASLSSFSTTHGSCSPGPDMVLCQLGELPAQDTAVIPIVVTLPVEGLADNSAMVNGDDQDPDISNNYASVSIMVFDGVPDRTYLPLIRKAP
jgi:uncharacterized repeat protein (TIGR01451 family)